MNTLCQNVNEGEKDCILYTLEIQTFVKLKRSLHVACTAHIRNIFHFTSAIWVWSSCILKIFFRVWMVNEVNIKAFLWYSKSWNLATSSNEGVFSPGGNQPTGIFLWCTLECILTLEWISSHSLHFIQCLYSNIICGVSRFQFSNFVN